MHATIFQSIITPTVKFVEGAIIFYQEGEPSVWGGGTRIFGVVNGGTIFFQWAKGWDQNFLRVKEGGTKTFSPKFFSTGGGQNFFQNPKGGGPEFFSVGKGEDQNLFAYPKGGTRKIWRPAITNRQPPFH